MRRFLPLSLLGLAFAVGCAAPSEEGAATAPTPSAAATASAPTAEAAVPTNVPAPTSTDTTNRNPTNDPGVPPGEK